MWRLLSQNIKKLRELPPLGLNELPSWVHRTTERIKRIQGTLLRSTAPKGAPSISLRTMQVLVLPKSLASDMELDGLQSTRNEPSTATVRRKRAS